MMHQASNPLSWLTTLGVAVLIHVGSAGAQELGRLRVEENFRRDPNGELLGRLAPGASFDVVGENGDWLELEVVGWMWDRSLQATARGGFDLVVSEADGENLRMEPSGDILGQMGRGTLLTSGVREPGWIRVSRRGWIWAESVEREVPVEGAHTTAADDPVSEPDDFPAAARPSGFVRLGGRGAILTAPDGDTLAVAATGADLEIVAREGNWVRVRVEGWTWLPDVPSDEGAGRDESDRPPITPEDLGQDPRLHAGRVVSWALQFISVEKAESIRTDFYEGEVFLLTRFGGADGPFVYVAVPPDRTQEVDSLLGLERLRVTGRVRTGASVLTGTPIIDLLSLERIRDGR